MPKTNKNRERKSKKGPDRLEYLSQLKSEFEESRSEGNKLQVLGNLANFAYDPQNYGYLELLEIPKLFIGSCYDGPPIRREFAIGGIANCCGYPPFKTFFLENGVMEAIFSNLSTPRIGITINSLCAFIFLFDVNYPNYLFDARLWFIRLYLKYQEKFV
ncbi:armadillo repeat-containing protein 7-like isoform X2 [Artemia franciscana]|uniref:Uncharacterized protein n=1 Tax=Artemia franciscana TaxID=6661 RepID=A0AA88L846_ARTSF|nr:hypothetical protein QYM36_002495 [Artemia franciscana]